MGLRERLRHGPVALAALAVSYAVQRPYAAWIGAPRWVRPGLAPACVAWAVARAVGGARLALSLGRQARRAPLLHRDERVLASFDELAPICSLVSDTHLAAGVPVELRTDPSQWPHGELPAGDD